jgi:FkbM family methyltransferase
MTTSGAAKLLRKADRLVELSPHFIKHPAHIWEVLRGVHPSSLSSLDKGWLRDIGFNTILDVGANTGQFARAAHYVFPNARIYSFEPLPTCLDRLNARMDGIPKFTAFESAIGDRDGVTTIHQSPSSPSSSVLAMTSEHTQAFPWSEGGIDVEVDMQRLDYFLPQMQVEGKLLIKIDVQGYSEQVLQGAPLLLAKADTVIIETSFVRLYEGESTFDEVYRLMIDAGFQFVGLLDHLEHPKTRETLQGDAIFRRR